MQKFLPHYLEVDAKFPEKYHYKLGFFFDFMSYAIDWTNIKYGKATYDFKDVDITFNNKFENRSVYLNFPAFKNLEIDADMTVNTWITYLDGPVHLVFDHFDFEIDTGLKVNKKGGFMDFEVKYAEVHFGDSYANHDNWFIEIIIN